MLSTKKYRHKEFTQRKNIFFGYFYANNLVISNNLLTHTHTHTSETNYKNACHARVIYNIKLEKQRPAKKFITISLQAFSCLIFIFLPTHLRQKIIIQYINS